MFASGHKICRVILVLSTFVGGTGAAYAQGSQGAQRAAGAWDIDFHGGLITGAGSTDGTAIASFPVGTPISTPNGVTSRAVSSWYFGDGASLLNSVNQQHASPQRLAPLDTTLRSSVAHSSGGFAFGVRASRRLTSRLSLEFAFDVSTTPVEFTDEAEDAIQAASDTFIDAWTGFLAASTSVDRSLSSNATFTEGSGGQILVTGALRFAVFPHGRFAPYLTAGIGGVSGFGDPLSATLTGQYGFRFGVDSAPFRETDIVTLHVTPDQNSVAGVFGGGFDYDLSSRHAVRVDLRFVVSGATTDVSVDANPTVSTFTPAFAISTFTNPSIQFSNNPSTNRTTSLSGPAISGLQTFTGSGSSMRFSLTVGYVMRF